MFKDLRAGSARCICIAATATPHSNSELSRSAAFAAAITAGSTISTARSCEMPGEPRSYGSSPMREPGRLSDACLRRHRLRLHGAARAVPVFPMFDRLTLPGIKLVPGVRWPVPCNWLQVQENARRSGSHVNTARDPAAARHGPLRQRIRQLSRTSSLVRDAGRLDLSWPRASSTTRSGFARRKLWARICAPSARSSKSATALKRATLPFMTFWILPIDDDEICHFYVSHITENEPMTFEKRRALEDFGQTADRPYADRQFIPGDYDAQAGQGRINDHGAENLATMDRGIVMLRRALRRDIEARRSRPGSARILSYAKKRSPHVCERLRRRVIEH